MRTATYIHLVTFAVTAVLSAPLPGYAQHRVTITAGEYPPFYPSEEGEVAQVADFELDALPVTNEQFLAFVQAEERWRRGEQPALFADSEYLAHWPEPLSVDGIEDQPVTRVSWFAARAYCQWHDGRLPTEKEWEYVARADEDSVDATRDPAFNQRMISFYSKPGGGTLREVGQAEPNVWGARDMIGLIWEWVDDYNASIVSSDSRQTGDAQQARFCGGAAATAENTREYATFMRFAFRSSLGPAFTLRNLGFRCAYDINDSTIEP